MNPKRSLGVTVAAVVLLLYGFLFLAGFIVLPRQALHLHPGQSMRMLRALAFPTLRLIAIEIGLVATSYGIFRLRRWARLSILSIGTGMAGLGTYVWISAFLGLPNHGLIARTSVLDSPLGLAFEFFLTLFVPGAWWILFFTRPYVTGQFTRASAVSSGTSHGETHETSHF